MDLNNIMLNKRRQSQKADYSFHEMRKSREIGHSVFLKLETGNQSNNKGVPSSGDEVSVNPLWHCLNNAEYIIPLNCALYMGEFYSI